MIGTSGRSRNRVLPPPVATRNFAVVELRLAAAGRGRLIFDMSSPGLDSKTGLKTRLKIGLKLGLKLGFLGHA
jgi:hypothetical protein